MKTVKFYTVGCKLNQYETQAIREQFQRAGFQELVDSVPADACVINTCTVTHRADRSSVYLIRRAHRENPDARVVVTGCLAQLDKDRISSLPGVSLIVENKHKDRIVPLLNSLNEQRATRVEQRATSNENRVTRVENQFGISYFKNHSRAFLKIQDGCNYRCSFCKVRLVRGKSRSRKPSEIKQETVSLMRNGYLEIVLSGICLGYYGKDLIPELSLAKLIQEIEAIPGPFRIRLSSIEVNDVTDELINIMAKSHRLCPHLHIPVQSGDEQVLRRMNRTYSPEQYIELVERIKKNLPGIAITTDVMVGFPGEKETNFKNTLELIRKTKPMRVHIFQYSRRINTPAYDFGESVSSNEIKSRASALQRLIQGLYSAYCQKLISHLGEVLVERKVLGCLDVWEGYTSNYIKVRLKSNLNLKNQIVQVRLKRVCKDFVLADTV